MRVVVRFLLTMVMLAGLGLADSVAYAEGTTDPTPPVPSDPVASPSSQSPSPGDQPTQPTPSQPSASQSASAPSPASPQAHSKLLAAAGDGHVSITDHPSNPTAYSGTSRHHVTFAFELDKGVADTAADVRFRCTLTGPRVAGTERDCGPGSIGPNSTSGSHEFLLGPGAKKYTFSVWAIYKDAAHGLSDVTSSKATSSWRMYSVYAPHKFMPKDGATFNNPVGSSSAGRKNLARMIKTINAMPGYREALHGGPCPAAGHFGVPGVIRVSLYSMTDSAFAKAMNRASKRCLSVQILMNDHLTRRTDPAWRRMENALGTRTKKGGVFRRSFAHRCHRACRGGGVLHTKMYLFNSTLAATAASRNKITDTVFVGSSNMTSNAAFVQWNDLYGDVRNPELFATFNSYFNKMRRDNGYHRNPYQGYTDNGGKYHTVFWPVTKGHDPEMSALRAIHCSGATGGTGINGHTAVYINMHAWFGLRGLAFQRIVRGLYAKGCYVRVLYSFMTPRVYSRLKSGTGGRMQLRRTIFGNHPGSRVAGVYSHFKNILVSGHYGGDSSARYVWTGSNNFTPDGKNFDEVMLRIKSTTVFRQYYKRFNYIKHRKSSGTYASFTEPRGGGRAP